MELLILFPLKEKTSVILMILVGGWFDAVVQYPLSDLWLFPDGAGCLQ